MRRTLKKFMLLPKSAPNDIMDKLCNYSTNRIYGILEDWNKTLCRRDIYVYEEGFAKIEMLK